jgi:predicted deacylase
MSEPRRTRIISEVDFDRNGKQHGFLRLFHSTHASAYGFIPIPIVVIRNGSGPTAFFMSGNHGDEYEGQVALCNLAKWLTPEKIRGRVILLPAANFPAAMAGRRVSPIDDANLNRVFPGDPDGTVTQQIAWYIEHELIPRADILCDLHSGGSSLMYVPSALIKQSSDPARREAQLAALRAFGAPDAYMTEAGPGGDATAAGGAERKGVLALGTELGGSGTVTAAALRIAERGVRNLLVHVGILPSSERIEPEKPTRLFNVGGQDYYTYAPEHGVFEPIVELGDTVRAGQTGGRLHFPETPWAQPVEVTFQRDGVVLCKRIPGRTARGDCLFHLGTPA